MSNVVEILVTAKNLAGPTMAAVNAEVNKAGKGMALFHKTALLAGVGLAAVGVEAVKMASKFDSEMLLLQTQAGVSKDKIAGLKSGVLDLAGKVGQDPDSLAESLYHVESNFESMGISSKKALQLTETAAKGATVGHAGLVDVTNALTAAVAAGIPGVENLDQAMGVLNATVGVGDMKMQDLASAFSTGMVATVKGYGLSITDVGAALAVFGDNNKRGAAAATDLRMSVQALAKPAAGGVATLKSLGLQADSLAKDMQKGGLKLALEDLVAHMGAAGVSSKQQGQIITDAFGKKAGTGLNILVGQMDRLESKYPALAEGAKGFGKAWADTQKSFAFQMKQLQTSFDALMISVGEKLIPPVQAFVSLMVRHKGVVEGAVVGLAGLLAATVAVSAAMKAAAVATLLFNGASTAITGIKGMFETVALRAMYMKDAFLAAGGGVKGLGAAFSSLSTGAKLGAVVTVVAGLAMALHELAGYDKAPISVDKLTTSLSNLGRTGAVTGELKGNLADLSTSIAMVSKSASDNRILTMVSDFGTWIGIATGPGISRAKENVDGIDKSLAALVQNGHADLAAAAAARLQKAWVAGGGTVDRFNSTMGDYKGALAGAALQSQLTADAQGKFGNEAQVVQGKLQAQQDVVDGLTQSLQALDAVNQGAFNSETAFENAIAAGTKAAKENGRTLNVHTDAGRKNRDIVAAIAAATDDYAAKLTKQNVGWGKVNSAYREGYDALVKTAEGLGYSETAAKALADSLLHMPKEVKVQGNIDDLEAKLSAAKAKLKSVPSSKRSALLADIRDLEAKIAQAKRDIANVTGKTVTITVNNVVVGHPSTVRNGAIYRAAGGHVSGPGSATSDDVPAWLSNGEFVVNAAATSKHRRLLEAINNGGMSGYARGGAVSDAAKQARSDARGALGGLSYFASMAGYRTPGFQRSTAGAGGIDDLVGVLNDWRDRIKTALSGAAESKMLKALSSFGASMLKNERALLSVNRQLDNARGRLSSLKDSFAQLRESVASNVVSFGSIAKQGTGQPGGAGLVVSQLQNDVATAKRFADDLAKLKGKGLNAQSLSEIAQAGITGGGMETAERLLGASGGDIKQINDLEKQLQAAGAAAGTATANAMYGAGIKAAEALVKGLEKSQKRIENIMVRAANAMAAQLKRAFGVKASGGVVGAAAAGGAHWGRTLVGEMGPEIVDLPIGSRVHTAGASRRMMAQAGGGGGRPVQVNLVVDGRTLAQVMLDPQRHLVQQLGGDVQQVYGRRL